ncbi:maleylpyruvate isomerase N-terminal domain-containing protein [Nocardioides marinus]|uniref:Maleylpyruvate isomerase n=1 Tax=Nocardioides marinus TaxID=374514 RepID=A0A7Z0C3S8_9ACTN|nr:maleylpyruvate isomerase [Nocardioides marinus]
MDRPSGDIEACRDAHARMTVLITGADDSVVRRPSLLPDWTVGHVLTHLARNADAMCKRVEGAMRGEVVEQYAGGAAGRAAEIEAGAARDARQIVDDAVQRAARVDDLFAGLSDECWTRPVKTVRGGEHPAALLPYRRWREVEIHLVDLGMGITSSDWPPELVDRMLPSLVAGLPDRADSRELVAWLLGRGSPPHLQPWA